MTIPIPYFRSLASARGLHVLVAILLRSSLVVAALAMASVATLAAAEGAGTLSGRVFNQATARYVNNARIVIKGTAHQTFTDSTGSYILHGVPAGPITVIASFTNLESRESSVTVSTGQRATLDFAFGGPGSGDERVVRLDEFRVEAAREVDAEAIAANEQRYSRNIKNVTATDSLG